MGGIFNYDGPLMSGLGKLADLVILNLLTLLFCIPIITIGPAVTACHYVALKIRRGEGYVLKNFWKSFKENLGQSIVIWLILAINIVLCLFVTLFFKADETVGSIVKGILLVALVFWVFIACWVFPMQSKFINGIGATIKNAFLFAFKYLFRTILMIIINLLPVVVAMLGFKWYSLLILFGFSAPAYLCAMLYDKKFQEVEDMIQDREAGIVIEEDAN